MNGTVAIHSEAPTRSREATAALSTGKRPVRAGIQLVTQGDPFGLAIRGDADGVNPGTAHHAKKFTGPHEHRVFRDAGHNLPQERPEEWARAIIDARKMAKS